MTPIINPLWFYLIDILSTIKETFFIGYVIVIIMLTAGVAGIAYYIIGIECVDCGMSEDNYNDLWKKMFLKPFKCISIAAIVVSCLTVFIPKEETMYKMMVANYVTYENVEIATDAIQDGVDYIMDKINGNEDK